MSNPSRFDYDDDPDFDNVDEEDEDEFFDCGMTPDGLCQLAGTEDCDWECPYNPNGVAAQARKANK